MRKVRLGRIWQIVFFAVFLVGFILVSGSTVRAEGTKDLTANGGYRPYTERYRAATFGQNRLSVLHVYLKSGEKMLLGTSVCKGTLYDTDTHKNFYFTNDEMGTSFTNAELAYLNSADAWIYKGTDAELSASSLPYAGGAQNKDAVLIDIPADADASTPGFIYNGAQEAAGADLSGKGAGYQVTDKNTLTAAGTVAADAKTNANSFTAKTDGIYTVVFFSSSLTGENPAMMKVSDTTTPFASMQKGGAIASWDISVYSGSTLQTGRVFTSTLFLNMGGNAFTKEKAIGTDALKAKIYAVTDDGYRYQIDFNGMDPFGFVFFANSRGLLTDASGSTSSLYHGLRSDNNYLSDITDHHILLNNLPTDSHLDKTYRLFYEAPSEDALKALRISTPATGGSITGFAFTGNQDTNANEGYVGKGGTFSFTVPDTVTATSYQIELKFGTGSPVVLSNTLVKGRNEIAWDGKDASGAVVPAGTYGASNITVRLKGGEIHFPLLDVEQNHAGIRITRLNGEGTAADKTTVYFNNSSENAGDAASPWTVEKNWTAGSEKNALTGVDSASGAMAFTNTNVLARSLKTADGKSALLGDGDQCALDLWAYYNTTVTPAGASFKLVDTQFTVTKVWARGGQAASSAPSKVTVTLKDETGASVAADAAGTAILNPVTYDTASSPSYTWSHLDPTKKYTAEETPVPGYSTSVTSPAARGSDGNWTETITNTYASSKLTLTKVWNMNGSAEKHPDSVTLTVYTDAAKTAKYGEYTLNEANHWTATVDPVDPSAVYYVYETAVGGTPVDSSYSTYTITGQGRVSGSADGGYAATVTNSFNNGNYMSVEALKIWTDGDTYAAYQPSVLYVTLKKNGVKVTKDALGNAIENPVQLSSKNSWYHIWPALLPRDTKADGYTLTESLDKEGKKLLDSGYTKTGEGPIFLHTFGYIGLDNTYKTASFTVTKKWDNGIRSAQPSSVTVTLLQSTDGGKTYAAYGKPAEITASTKDAAGKAWGYTWTGLPSYTYASGSEVQILYKVSEILPDSSYSEKEGTPSFLASGNAWSQTLTNTYNYTKLTVRKTWEHGKQDSSAWPSSVSVTLYADGKAVGDAVKLNDGNGWSYTWEKLDRTKKYTVAEAAVKDYKTSGGTVSGSASAGYTASFANTFSGTITPTTSSFYYKVMKIWRHGTQARASWPTSVTFKLYVKNGSVYSLVKAVTLNSSNADKDGCWVYTFKDLDSSKTYRITEGALSNYTASAKTVKASDGGYVVTVINTYSKRSSYSYSSSTTSASTVSTDTSTSSSTSGRKRTGADTGDFTDAGIFLLLFGAAAASAAGIFLAKRKKKI